MKKITLLFISLLISMLTIASGLYLLPTGSITKTKDAFSRKDLTVHFYNDHFAVISTDSQAPAGAILLDSKAWADESIHYFILYFKQETKDSYMQEIAPNAKMLYQGDDFVVVSASDQNVRKLFPSIHGGMVRISPDAASLDRSTFSYRAGSLSPRDDIFDYIGQVNQDTLQSIVQHLQDYGTRNCYEPESIEAQNWILARFQSYGLYAELHDFYMSNPASDNVLAYKPGSLYPDEYVVLGAHYDSYAWGSSEPGADDNATGTAGILEAARILSQYEFDRSIIFACWSGEEYGLYGSEAWAGEAAADGMNILGYFNIDMAGYLAPFSNIHTDIIAPISASELKQFYKDVCSIYLPDFETNDGALSGGDSDHTSFNNNGYQGIFPFEDSDDYSPYIHTANDLIGPSVNNFPQHKVFVQATIASVATMASALPSPENLIGIAGDGSVTLQWTGVEEVDHYNIYRNADLSPYASTADTAYIDLDVENFSTYTYYVTAVFLDSGDESSPSNSVSVKPMPPIVLPFFDDFETGAQFWTMEDTWGLQNGTSYSPEYSLTESPAGDYTAEMSATVTLRSIDLSVIGATSAELSFWTRYNIENGYDYMFLEASADGTNWDQLATFTGNLNTWTLKTYSLDNYLTENNVILRFRFFSDSFTQDEGMFIDDLEVMIAGVGTDENKLQPGRYDMAFHPNPVKDLAVVDFSITQQGLSRLQIYDSKGQLVRTIFEKWTDAGFHQEQVDLTGLKSGIYYGVLENDGRKISRKLIITK